jgi:hypothetical protein
MDGLGGARVDLASAISVDIANGAPTGADATDRIVATWVDGAAGLNHEHLVFTESADGGATWSGNRNIEVAGDRPVFSAPAISPDGSDVYVVYNAFTTPYRDDTTSPRGLTGVMLHADVAGSTGAFTQVHRGPTGDPRGSSANALTDEFLGDYVYAAASRTFGTGVWNDASNAADCPAVDTFRAALYQGAAARPPVQSVCPATFGNTNILGTTVADPTP